MTNLLQTVRCVVVVVVALFVSRIARGDDDSRFLDGLRQRRLFTLADRFCRDRLAAPNLAPRDAARFTAERLRVFAEQALNSPPDARLAIVNEAKRLTADFSRQYPQHPRATLVGLQDALLALSLGELARQENEVGGDAAALDLAKQLIRQATRSLEQIERELAALSIERARKPAAADDLNAEEIASLLGHTRYQLAVAFRAQGLCYPDDHADRLVAVSQSLEQLARMLQQVAADEPLAARARLDEVVGLRLMKKIAEAQERWRQTIETERNRPADAQLRAALRAEGLRLKIAARDWTAVRTLLGNPDAEPSPEWSLAQVEGCVGLWRAADESKDATAATAWQNQATALTQRLEEQHGPYWRMRAELLLVTAAGNGGQGTNAEILARSADNLYLRGQFDQAIAAYEKAAEQFAAARNSMRRFELLFKAALVQQKRMNHADAAQRLQSLAAENPTLPRAAETHLLAAWNKAQQARQNSAVLDEYQSLLKSQLEKWPREAATDQARVWLATLYETREAWRDAALAVRDIPRESSHYAAASKLSAACWPKYFSQLDPAADSATRSARQTEAATAAAELEQSLRDGDGRWLTAWNDVQRAAALAAGRLRLNFTADGQRGAEQTLRGLVDNDPQLPAAVRTEASALIAMAIANQPDRADEALKYLREANGGSPAQQWETVVSLRQLLDGATADRRAAIVRLLTASLSNAQAIRAQLPAAKQKTLDVIRAETLAAANQSAEALAAFRQLAKSHPEDSAIQANLAEQLLAGTDRTAWQEGLDQWRRVANRTRPRTPEWFHAKYAIAAAQIQLGDKSSAAQLIRFLLETPPGLEGTVWKGKFERLLKSAQ